MKVGQIYRDFDSKEAIVADIVRGDLEQFLDEATEQVEALKQGRIHAAFSTSLTLPRGLDGHRMADDALACCVHERHAIARRQRVELSALANESFVMFSRDTLIGAVLVLGVLALIGGLVFLGLRKPELRFGRGATANRGRGIGRHAVPLHQCPLQHAAATNPAPPDLESGL